MFEKAIITESDVKPTVYCFSFSSSFSVASKASIAHSRSYEEWPQVSLRTNDLLVKFYIWTILFELIDYVNYTRR